jgi:hypothetical protein
MEAYLLQFAMFLAVQLWPGHDLGAYRRAQIARVTADIVSTDATPEEALQLENLAGFESGWQPGAVGRQGELGAFQIMPRRDASGAVVTPLAVRKEWKERGAHEALRRLREQGIAGYCGCRYPTKAPCPEMIEHRTWPSRLYRMAFDPPTSTGAEAYVRNP